MKTKIFRILLWGGFGDIILITGCLSALKKKFPAAKVVLYCPNNKMEIFNHNPYVDRIIPLFFFQKPYLSIRYWRKRFQFTRTDLSFLHIAKLYRVPASQIYGEILRVKNDDRTEIYLTRKEEEWALDTLKNYTFPVILHVTSECSVNHMWPAEKWEELVRRMNSVTFIQIGYHKEARIEGAVDFRGKTSIRQAMALIKYCRSFAGVDSFFGHVTNAFDIPGVILFGDSSPIIWGHANNINISKNLECSPCYETLLGENCPYGKLCMHTIAVDEVQQALEKQLMRNEVPAVLNNL